MYHNGGGSAGGTNMSNRPSRAVSSSPRYIYRDNVPPSFPGFDQTPSPPVTSSGVERNPLYSVSSFYSELQMEKEALTLHFQKLKDQRVSSLLLACSNSPIGNRAK